MARHTTRIALFGALCAFLVSLLGFATACRSGVLYGPPKTDRGQEQRTNTAP